MIETIVNLHHGLIEQARHLATRERGKPRQISLRRAISAAYYALFHLLVREGLSRLIPNAPARLRMQACRAFSHKDMKSACQEIAKPSRPLLPLLVLPLEADLKTVADIFVELQDLRHFADYDLSQSFSRIEVLDIIAKANSAVSAWRRVRNLPNANVFLAALLFNNRWNK
jgi:uncharacterized protein (UPF0332 family)